MTDKDMDTAREFRYKLPELTNQPKWSKTVKHGWYPQNFAEERVRRIFDHMYKYCYGRKQYEVLVVSMPYKEAIRDLQFPLKFITRTDIYSGFRVGKELTFEAVRWPDEWSWWNPGNCAILGIAVPGVIKGGST